MRGHLLLYFRLCDVHTLGHSSNGPTTQEWRNYYYYRLHSVQAHHRRLVLNSASVDLCRDYHVNAYAICICLLCITDGWRDWIFKLVNARQQQKERGTCCCCSSAMDSRFFFFFLYMYAFNNHTSESRLDSSSSFSVKKK